MAGFFGLFDYTRPGPGVDKNAPKKKPFFLFFELVGRKFGRLIFLNLLYFIAILPLLTGVYLMLYKYVFSLLPQLGAESGEIMAAPLLPSILFALTYAIPVWLRYALLALSAVLYGPVTCGQVFMLRNFALQRHVWNSDFFDTIKKNFKQGLILGLLDIILFSIFFVYLTIPTEGSTLLTVIKYLSVPMATIYLFMRNYTFIMAVTLDLKIVPLIKNAWIFAWLGMWRNFLVLIVNAVLLLATIIINQTVELVLMPLFLFSFMGFLSVFTCFPVLQKHIINRLDSDEQDTP